MKSISYKLIFSIFITFFLLSYFYIVYASYVNSPYFDSWRFFTENNNFYSSIIIHNEHIINAIAAWFKLDSIITSASGTLQLVFIFLLLCSLLALYTMRISGFSIYETLILLSVTLSGTQFTNITWSFQIGFLGSFVMGCWAIYVAAISSESKMPIFWLSVSFLLAVTSAMSLASGILLLPILVTFLVLFCRKNRATFIYLPIIIFVFIYLFKYSLNAGGFHPIDVARSIVFSLAVIGSFFGSILDLRFITGMSIDTVYVSVSVLMGALMCAWFLLLMIRAYHTANMSVSSAIDLWSLVAIIWLGISAGAIGLGRSNLPMTEAISSRYVTISCIFICLLLVLSRKLNMHVLQQHYVPRAVCALVVGLAVLAQYDRMAQAEVAGRRFENAETALLNGAFVSTDILNIYPSSMAPIAKRIGEVMRFVGTSTFNEQRYRLISRHLFDGFLKYDGPCGAAALTTELDPLVYKIEGEMKESAGLVFVVADADSKVLAVGSTRKRMAGLRIEGRSSGFVVVAPRAGLGNDHDARIFGVDVDRLTFCYVGSQNIGE